MNFIKIVDRILLIALPLCAILPIFTKMDALFYISGFLLIVLFITVLANIIKAYRENPKNILKLSLNSARGNLYFIFICVVAISVGYFMKNSNHIITWSVLLGIILLTMMIPTKKRMK